MGGEFRCNWAWCSLLWCVSVSVLAIKEFDGKSIVQAAEKNSVHHKQARRKLDDVGGDISIDCGLLDEVDYIDSKTKLSYTSDSKFIDTGENRNISVKFISETLQRTFENVRSFPEGNRNCYTVRPPEGRGTVYLLRASFMYGNYDGLNLLPKFDLYIGVNLWDHITFDNASHVVIMEILHVPLMDVMHVCLLNTYGGTPFISALEVRHCHNSIYPSKTGTLALYRRLDFGSTTNEIVRFGEDIYDRIWHPYNLPHCQPLNTSFTIDSLNYNPYRPPSAVMRTAIRPKNSSDFLNVLFDTGDSVSRFYVYMHFAEIEKLQENEHREFNISLNENLWESVVLHYLNSSTIYNKQPIRGPKLLFSMSRKENSTHPPIINAMEIYIEKDSYQAPTDQEDVNAIMDIKRTYILLKSWQGDPCAPVSYSWDGLNCSYDGYHAPRIIALNLSSSRLSGTISQSFSMLKSLQYLDLSNNGLTGSLPDFFLKLPLLRTLNLSGNRLSGEIPSLLKERSDNGSLLLSVDGNPDLCMIAPCTEDKRSTFPRLAVVAIPLSVVFLVALVIVVSIIWRGKCSRKPANQPVRSHEEVEVKSNNNQFTYSQIVSITKNFQKTVGKGGFGTVYHGSLSDDTQVAVKMLSSRSQESSKQFQTEAELLMRVHHRNLASFLGYCNEGGHIAIIYEFMAYGNLQKCLSGAVKELSSWRNRIQIAVDAAQGLEYLHHGCKPPIIHRDIKTSNILLNEKMQAKVSDFGFSKFFSTESKSHVSTNVVGTFGYLDPEYCTSNRLTEKSDVYSFGIVLLELITGQPAIIKGQENTHIVNWVNPFLARGDLQKIVDPRFQEDFDFGSMWKVVEVAIACVSPIAIQRPSMSYIVLELKESLEMEAAREQKWGKEKKMLKSTSSFNMHVVDLEVASGPDAR